jgi:hypothetical protein
MRQWAAIAQYWFVHIDAFELTLEIDLVANELAPSRSRMRVDLRVDSEF